MSENSIVLRTDVNDNVLATTTALDLFAPAAGLKLFSSLDMEGNRDKIFNAMGDADYKLKKWTIDNPGKFVKVVDVVAHNVEIVSEDGEVVEATRTVWIDNDGLTYSSVANGVKDSMGRVFMLYGMPNSWPEGGLPLRLKEVETRRGFRTYNIVIGSDQPEEVKTVPKNKK